MTLCSDRDELRDIMSRPEHIVRYLQPGRVVRMVDVHGSDWGVGVITESVKKPRPNLKRGAPGAAQHKVTHL